MVIAALPAVTAVIPAATNYKPQETCTQASIYLARKGKGREKNNAHAPPMFRNSKKKRPPFFFQTLPLPSPEYEETVMKTNDLDLVTG